MYQEADDIQAVYIYDLSIYCSVIEHTDYFHMYIITNSACLYNFRNFDWL